MTSRRWSFKGIRDSAGTLWNEGKRRVQLVSELAKLYVDVHFGSGTMTDPRFAWKSLGVALGSSALAGCSPDMDSPMEVVVPDPVPQDTSRVRINQDVVTGQIPPHFYGVNTFGDHLVPTWNSEGQSNTGWHLARFDEAGYNLIRFDARLERFDENFEPDIETTQNVARSIELAAERTARGDETLVVLIASYQPEWLADTSQPCQDNKQSCPPLDYNVFGELVVRMLDHYTNDGEHAHIVGLEVWNEPHNQHFLSDLPHGDPRRVKPYNDLFAAVHNAVKEKYPDMKIYGPVSTSVYPEIVKGYLAVHGDKGAGITSHEYARQGEDMDVMIEERLQRIQGWCATYGANCDEIAFTEFGTDDIKLKEDFKRYSAQLTLAYAAAIEKAPAITNMTYFTWAEYGKHKQGTNRFEAVAEPNLGGELHAPYHVAKNMTKNHAPGNRVVETEYDEAVRAVASIDSEGILYVSLVNREQTPRVVAMTVGSREIYDTLGPYGVKHQTITP